MAFASLIAAANGCLATMYTRWLAGTLQADLVGFSGDVAPSFPDDDPNARTVGNWLVLIQANTSQLANAFQITNESLFMALVQTIYRICYQTVNMQLQNIITNAQATVVLTAMNAHLS